MICFFYLFGGFGFKDLSFGGFLPSDFFVGGKGFPKLTNFRGV